MNFSDLTFEGKNVQMFLNCMLHPLTYPITIQPKDVSWALISITRLLLAVCFFQSMILYSIQHTLHYPPGQGDYLSINYLIILFLTCNIVSLFVFGQIKITLKLIQDLHKNATLSVPIKVIFQFTEKTSVAPDKTPAGRL